VDEKKLAELIGKMLDERMGALEERLDAKLASMEERFDAKLDAKLAPIEEKLDAVYEHVAQLSKDMTEVKQRLGRIEGDILRHERILKDHNHRLADVEQGLRIAKQ
jgi:ParB-like chromosome segregation protein Spo0J